LLLVEISCNLNFTGSKLIVKPEMTKQSKWSLNFDVKVIM